MNTLAAIGALFNLVKNQHDLYNHIPSEMRHIITPMNNSSHELGLKKGYGIMAYDAKNPQQYIASTSCHFYINSEGYLTTLADNLRVCNKKIPQNCNQFTINQETGAVFITNEQNQQEFFCTLSICLIPDAIHNGQHQPFKSATILKDMPSIVDPKTRNPFQKNISNDISSVSEQLLKASHALSLTQKINIAARACIDKHNSLHQGA